MDAKRQWIDNLVLASKEDSSLLKDLRKCVSLLRDLLPGDNNRAKVNALKMAFEEKIPNLLERDRNTGDKPEQSIARISKSFASNTGLNLEMSEWAVRVWGVVIEWLQDVPEDPMIISNKCPISSSKDRYSISSQPLQSSINLQACFYAAEQGSVPFQLYLGDVYSKGLELPQDYDLAARWYREAISGGSDEAKIRLGILFAEGLVETENIEERLACIEAAANAGNMEAQCRLGIMYEYGRGVPQNYGEAAKWYRKSADQGNTYGHL